MSRAARMLRYARRKAGYSQRELAEHAGVPQPTVARIESGAVTPRVDTLDRLLRTCGYMLEMDVYRGEGVDTTLIDQMLDVSPARRLEQGRRFARFLRSARVKDAS